MAQTRRRLDKKWSMGLVSLAVLGAGALGFTGCSSAEGDGACVSDQMYFAQKVWAPVLAVKCIGCHSPSGQAGKSGLVLRGSTEAGFLDANYEVMKNAASLQQDGQSQLLAMPTGGTASRKHPGGVVIEPGSDDYAALEALVNRFGEPSSCETNLNAVFAGVQLATPEETLRKAALSLVGRLPTAAETQAVEKGGLEALDPILDRMMTEDAFYTRLKEIYNDVFLTDRYIENEDAVNLLNDVEYYSPKWYNETSFYTDSTLIEKYGARNFDDLYNKLRSWTNRGVAREPLELVAHVVRNNRPFTEVLTANYIMVNPFSAQAYMVPDAKFKNDADPNEFIEVKLKLASGDFPHAGILTSPMFLNRYPTTDTNRNRARARRVYEFFLGTDLLKTAEQPIDQTIVTEVNPTMNASACTVCHVQMDPIAGAFRNFDDRARYDPMKPPLDDMRPPGFAGENVPYEKLPQGLQWLAPRIANDSRFALAAAYAVFTGLTGQAPPIAPTDTSSPDFEKEFDSYLAIYSEFSKIAHDFTDSKFDLKVVFKEIIKSPYYRAKNSKPLTKEQQSQLSTLGMGRFLTPEQLHRKVWAVMGYPWRPRAFEDGGWSNDYLMIRDQYRMLYGGIDSNDVVTRVKTPNGIMANIAERMANEMACRTVPIEFWKSAEERLLFPHVELTFEPEDKNGFPVEPAVKAIKKNIQHLHERILGEKLPDGHPEIERTYQLFLETYREGVKGISDKEQEALYPKSLEYACQVQNDFWTRVELPDEDKLTQDPNYVIRSWMAVTTYLLSDYQFIYE
jgi:hypothetical protein